jgi:membrane fusion protein, multidrug efflux system
MRINRSFIVFFSILAAFSTVSCNKEKSAVTPGGPRQQGPLGVDGFIVEQKSISDRVEVPGTLLPAEETQIRTEVSGRVVQLNVQEGKLVQKGSLLVKLFDEDLQAQLRKLEVQLEIANKTEERQRDLLEISGISQQDYDLSALQVDNLKADMQAVKIAISKTEIRAPYTGRVGLRNISLGTFLSPTEVVTTIRQVENLKLEFSIPEKYARDVAPGSLVSFRVDGGAVNHAATVMATESGVDQATRTLRVRALVDARHRELVPGVFARVSLHLGNDTEALLVPSQAVIPQARGKQIILYRNDSVRFVEVETGMRDSAFVQILKGIKVGDTVVTTGLMAIRPQSKIRLVRITRHGQ